MKMKLLKSRKGLKRAGNTTLVTLTILSLFMVASYDGRALLNAEKYGPQLKDEPAAVFNMNTNTMTTDEEELGL